MAKYLQRYTSHIHLKGQTLPLSNFIGVWPYSELDLSWCRGNLYILDICPFVSNNTLDTSPITQFPHLSTETQLDRSDSIYKHLRNLNLRQTYLFSRTIYQSKFVSTLVLFLLSRTSLLHLSVTNNRRTMHPIGGLGWKMSHIELWVFRGVQLWFRNRLGDLRYIVICINEPDYIEVV